MDSLIFFEMAKVIGLRQALESLERDVILRAMAETKGNSAKAARILKINRTTLVMKRRKRGLKMKRRSTKGVKRS